MFELFGMQKIINIVRHKINIKHLLIEHQVYICTACLISQLLEGSQNLVTDSTWSQSRNHHFQDTVLKGGSNFHLRWENHSSSSFWHGEMCFLINFVKVMG